MFKTLLVTFFLLFATSQHSYSFNEIFDVTNKRGEILVGAIGDITLGSGKRLVDKLVETKAKTLWIASTGGSLEDSMEIANFVFENKIKVVVMPDAPCASGCALIAFASPERSMFEDSRIGLHRAYLSRYDNKGNLVRDKEGNPMVVENDGTRVINQVILTKMVQWNVPLRSIEAWMTTNPKSTKKAPGMFWIKGDDKAKLYGFNVVHFTENKS